VEAGGTDIGRRRFLAAVGSSLLVLVSGDLCRGQRNGKPRRAPTAWGYDLRCLDHLKGVRHPESPGRVKAIADGLYANPDFGSLHALPVRIATDNELRLVHPKKYIDLVTRETTAGADRLSTGDTTLSGGSLLAARCAAGSVLAGVDAVAGGKVRGAFCAVRPPGHHASAERGMGFCLFNNAALAARYAQTRHKLAKVLIIDWDVHHGNGTQDIFYEDGTVLFFSVHQSPWYPGTGSADETGKGHGEGLTINCPLKAGAGRKEVMAAFETKLVPAADRFEPDLVVISAGFDSRKDDPLGRFTLDDADFADLTALVRRIAKKHSGGRVVSVLEGGYNLKGLASAAEAHVEALMSPL
jgi:acetoin utilization deacetylase AcuC-like enzyme